LFRRSLQSDESLATSIEAIIRPADDSGCAAAPTVASSAVSVSLTPRVWKRRTQLLCAIGVSLWSAVVAGRQTVAPAALSGALRDHVKEKRFEIVTSIRGLPLGVRDGLQTLFGSQTLDIAEPGAEFQSTDVNAKPRLPIRRLVAAGCTIEYCLVYYERGGVAHTWHVALFHWTPAATRFEWGGTAPGGLATIDDVRNAILSGVIKGPAKFW
jgi:hypothetical protein